MLSRVAESIYWMSRYAERAENVARILDVSLQLMLDLPEGQGDPWEGVIAATGDLGAFEERYGRASRDTAVRFLLSDPDSPNSIVSSLRASRENARSVREVISSEMWERVNKSYLQVHDWLAQPSMLDDPHELLSEVKVAAQSFVGTTYLTMSHNEGWHFGRVGRLLERADQTSRILDAKQALLLARPVTDAPSLDEIHLAALLRSVSALEMYRQRHGHLQHTRVCKFLLLDSKFPRSVRYCVNKAERSLHAITGTPLDSTSSLPERRLGRLKAECEFAVVEEILEQGLAEYLDQVQAKLNDVGTAIHDTFFAARPEDSEAFYEGVPLAAQ